MRWAMPFALVLLATAAAPARVEFVDTDYIVFFEQFSAIAAINGLTSEQANAAEAGAAEWYYRWPCKGDTRLLPGGGSGDGGGIQVLALPNYKSAFDVAFIEMISRWIAIDMGRPTAKTCQIAFARARGMRH